MKRRLLIIAIFLLLGGVVNVAVAWGCAVLVNPFVVPPEDKGERTVRGSPVDWQVWAWTRMGVKQITALRGSGSKNVWELRSIYGRGWPAISMWCALERTYSMLDPPPVEIVPIQGGIETGLPDWHRTPILAAKRVLPLRPIWPGFLINTLFYAALLWLLIPGPFTLRWFLRLRRGLCPKCAYPMGESSVCTECGGALPSRIRAARGAPQPCSLKATRTRLVADRRHHV